ncbi:hypothetical protein [Neorhizobium sp. T7_12]|uniref:hypothetical protein n=1 Tax=Neorhizobium sp. T7_12 TaxID=2093832 RepID=UPI000CF938D7|nr:hypothetical protein [Neorhizobium sp. T7_12]
MREARAEFIKAMDTVKSIQAMGIDDFFQGYQINVRLITDEDQNSIRQTYEAGGHFQSTHMVTAGSKRMRLIRRDLGAAYSRMLGNQFIGILEKKQHDDLVKLVGQDKSFELPAQTDLCYIDAYWTNAPNDKRVNPYNWQNFNHARNQIFIGIMTNDEAFELKLNLPLDMF